MSQIWRIVHSALAAGHLIEQICSLNEYEFRMGLAQPGVRRLDSKQCREGAGVVGGHHVWLVSVTTVSQGTQVHRGMGPRTKHNMTIIGYACRSINYLP